VNLFNDPQKAIAEFTRGVRSEGIVSWGDEDFSRNCPDSFRKKLLTEINPSFLKSRPAIPGVLKNAKDYDVYDGIAYLVIGKEKNDLD